MENRLINFFLEGEPPCSRLLPPEEAELFLRAHPLRAHLADSIAESCLPRDKEGYGHWRARAMRDRDLIWMTRPGDKFWITVDPSNHPEVKTVLSFVVVRDGDVIFRDRLGVF
jgi:hypothetical protein